MEEQQDWEMGLMEVVCGKYKEEAREVSDQIAENMEFVEKTAVKFEALQDDLIKTPGPAVPGVSEKDMMNTDSISKYEQEKDDGNEEVVVEEVKEG